MASTSVSGTPFMSCHCRQWCLPFHASMHFHTTIMHPRVTHKLWRRTFTTACGKYNAETVYVTKCWSGAVFPEHFHSQTPFWLQKITMNFHILAQVNIVCPDDRYPRLNPYISELISVICEYIIVAYIKMHCMNWPNYWLSLTLWVQEFP